MQVFDLRNLRLTGEVQSFDGKLTISPIREAQARMQRDSRVGTGIVTATLRLHEDLAATLGTDGQTLVFRICDLLCFAGRRGVTVRWPEHWGRRQSLIVRGGTSPRGPIEHPGDIRVLLENGLASLLDEQFERKTRCRLGLHMFLGWQLQQFLDMKFVHLWMTLEMLARQHAKACCTKKKDYPMVSDFLRALNLPPYDGEMIRSMYIARNLIVHGNIEAREQIIKRFGHLAIRRHEELFKDDLMWKQFAQKTVQYLPTSDKKWAEIAKREFGYVPIVPDFGRSLLEPVLYLSRILEKAFLAFFDMRGTWYFEKAEYFTTWEP